MRGLLAALLAVIIAAPSVAAESEEERAAAALEASCGAATLVAAAECIRATLSDEDHAAIVESEYSSLIRFHFGLGMGLRNQWGLWGYSTPIAKYLAEAGVEHPDNMSGVIINSYWLHHNVCSLDRDDAVEAYLDFENALKPVDMSQRAQVLKTAGEYLECDA